MKRITLLFALFLCATSALAQDITTPKWCPVPTVDRAIRQVADDWKNAYNTQNPDRVAALYAEDATYLTQHFVTGIVHGRAAIKAYVKKGTDARYRVDSIDVLATDCSGDFAYTVTRYQSTNGEHKARGVNLVVLKRIGGKWLIVAHEAAVPDPATAIQSLQLSSARPGSEGMPE